MLIYSLFSVLLGYIWLLGTFVNSSCDIKINVNIVQNCCRNLAVRGLIQQKCKARTMGMPENYHTCTHTSGGGASFKKEAAL